MYEGFYQLSSNPFRLAPDPNFCFSHPGYKSAREYLEYALEQGEGFVMVTGRPGTGKTLLVETFLKEIDPGRVIAKRIAVSNYGADDLLRAVAYAYELDVVDLDKATLRHQIQQFFLQQEQAGRRVLLIIDEAQALRHNALEELRILADLQTESRLMLQLFLVGQESLQDLMSTPDMEQFQQRVIANYHLMPLSLLEARAYIEHRLLHAGWGGDPEFTSTAVLSIYQLSNGVPRHINKICNRLMLLGFGKGSYIFDEEDVQSISHEMREELLTPMEPGSTLDTDADTLTNLPGIHDGEASLADLAIRLDKVDADALAIAEASRLAARQIAQFTARHHDDPASWNMPQSASASTREDPVAETTGQASESGITATDTRHVGSALAEQLLGHFKWRDALVVTAATMAITTLSIAALPSLFGNTPDDDANAAVLVAEQATAPVVSGTPAVAGVGLNAIPAAPADDTLATSGEGPDSHVTGDTVPASVDTVLTSEVLVPVPQLLVELQPAVADADGHALPQQDPQAVSATAVETAALAITPVQEVVAEDLSGQIAASSHDHRLMSWEHSADADFQPTRGDIVRDAATQPLPVVAGPVEGDAIVEIAGVTHAIQDKTIAELLSLGEQASSDYRLLTPEEDNAYGYFSAVLRLDPANKKAHAGIQEIVDIYVTITRKAANRHDNGRAGRYVDRGLSIQPNNQELLALKDRIDRNLNSASTRTGPGTHRVRAPEPSSQKGMMSRITTFFKKRKAEARRGEIIVPAGWDS